MANDPRELHWFLEGTATPLELGATMPAGTYYAELPNEHGEHSIQVSSTAALASSGGAVQVSNQQQGAVDVAPGLIWAVTTYTTPAIVAAADNAKIVLLPPLLVLRRRFAFVVTTEGVARIYVR